jgi:glycosyltransferase involved in cell wall biosynthesis
LFPASIVSNEAIEKWFYIDMTLRQLFRCYELGASMDKRARESAIEREKDGYRAAKGIMTLSQWAAESVVRDYGIPPARVHAIVPGANIAAGHYSKWFSVASYRQADPERPLRLVFTGKYWKRKGLDRLLEAFLLARARGANLSLRVIGVDRETIPTKYCDATAVEWIGFLDKRTESTAFLNAVSDCDIGCLLSRAEAAGIAVREYCALGLVTLCTDAGGMPEMPIPEASLSVPVDASNEETAEVLLRLCRDRQATEQMRQRAWSLRCEALWDSAVAQMRTQLQTS